MGRAALDGQRLLKYVSANPGLPVSANMNLPEKLLSHWNETDDLAARRQDNPSVNWRGFFLRRLRQAR